MVKHLFTKMQSLLLIREQKVIIPPDKDSNSNPEKKCKNICLRTVPRPIKIAVWLSRNFCVTVKNLTMLLRLL